MNVLLEHSENCADDRLEDLIDTERKDRQEDAEHECDDRGVLQLGALRPTDLTHLACDVAEKGKGLLAKRLLGAVRGNCGCVCHTIMLTQTQGLRGARQEGLEPPTNGFGDRYSTD